MATELDKSAKKNTKQKLKAISKKQDIKLHNLKAARKANKADPAGPYESRSWYEKLTGTERSKSLGKEIRKLEKSEKWFDKQSDKLEKHGVWSKKNKKGSAMASLEKKSLLKTKLKGPPSKAKIERENLDVNRPDFPRKPTYGGTTKKTYANAYKKKNK
jgi:hypothetical protein